MPTNNALNLNAQGLANYDGSGVFSAVTVTDHSVLIGGTANDITSLALTDGQLAIGSTGADPVAATLTAGTGISITNGAGSITIDATATGVVWTDVTGTTQTIAANNGYFADNAGTVTFTLPATSTIGDIFFISGLQGDWTISQAAGQQIALGTQASTVGVTGTVSSTAVGDSIMCVATNTGAASIWRIVSAVGNLSFA